MDASIRTFVRERALDRCEYCRTHQDDDPVLRFHVEHIVAQKHRGGGDESNLALTCQQCNLHKGSNLSGIDSETDKVVDLFHPRRDPWHEHFTVDGCRIVGLTPTGRATVEVLCMNDQDCIELRAEIEYPDAIG